MNRHHLSKEETLRLALMEADCPSIAAGRRMLKAKPQPATPKKTAEQRFLEKGTSRS